MKLVDAIGKISPPPGTPAEAVSDPVTYIESAIRNGVSILLIVAFLAMFLWTIFAGFRFVTSGGDEKTVSQAWSSIYWGIIGMIVVMSSYAIVRLVEIFFGITIFSDGLTDILP